MIGTCASPGCDTEPIPGRKFCEADAAVLDRVRGELEEPGRKRLYGPRGKPKRCSYVECPEWAKPGKPYCLYHLRFRGEE